MVIDGKVLEAGRRLLEGVTPAQLREVAIQALRDARREEQSGRNVQLNSPFGQRFVGLLADLKGTAVGHSSVKEICPSAFDYDFMAPVAEFFWWLMRAGLAYPLLHVDSHSGAPCYWRLTTASEHFLDHYDDHPLSGGFLGRLMTRCPGLDDEVIDLFEDARSCLDSGLVRPAAVILGVAYETALMTIAESLAARKYIDVKKLAAAHKAWEVARLIREALPLVVTDKRERPRYERAIDFAHQLRERRNDGGHRRPKHPFDDVEEVQELLVSAARHMPTLWSLTQSVTQAEP